MLSFDNENLLQLKKLCRIESSPEEDEEIKKNLSRMLEYVSQLNEVNTENTIPCRFVLNAVGGIKHQLREDITQETLSREQFLANAPDQIGGMIRTPPILT